MQFSARNVVLLDFLAPGLFYKLPNAHIKPRPGRRRMTVWSQRAPQPTPSPMQRYLAPSTFESPPRVAKLPPSPVASTFAEQSLAKQQSGPSSPALTLFRLSLLDPCVSPSLLSRLRAVIALDDSLSQRDLEDLVHRLDRPPMLSKGGTGVYYLDSIGREDRRREMEMEAVELEVALECAKRGFARGLRAFMLRQLARGDEGTRWITAAWEGFVKARSPSGKEEDLKGFGARDTLTVYLAHLARLSSQNEQPATVPPDRIIGLQQSGTENIIPPHMSSPGFKRALTLSLLVQTETIPSTYALFIVENRISDTARSTYVGWLSAIRLARMVHNKKDSALVKHVELLTRNRKAGDIWGTWQRLLQARDQGWLVIPQPDHPQADESEGVGLQESGLTVFRDTDVNVVESSNAPDKLKSDSNISSRPLLPLYLHSFYQTAFISSFLLLHRPDLTANVWQALVESNAKLTTHHYSALLSGFAKNGSLPEAERTWQAMQDRGVQPDRAGWNAWLQVLFAGRNWEDGMREFNRLRDALQKESDNGGQGVGVQTWNTVLHGLLINGRSEEARMVWREMEREEQVDIVSMNTILRYQARHADWVGLARVMRTFQERNIKPDAYTFTTVLEAVARRRGDVKQGVRMVWSVMRREGVNPNGVMIGKILDALVRARTPENVQAAIGLLEELEETEPKPVPGETEEQDEENVRINEVTYTGLIAGIWRSELAMDEKRERTADLLARMQGRGLGANRVTHNTLIANYLECEAPEDAMAMWREMREKGIQSTPDTYQILLRGLTKGRHWERLHRVHLEKVLLTMQEEGFVPEGSLRKVWEKASAPKWEF